MGQVFVSYSRQDIEIADALVTKLSNAGLDIWIDREDIRAGRHWRTEIVSAIDESDALLLLLSPQSAASDNVLKEVTLAQGANRRIFPVILTETELLPDMRYLLAGVQLIDMAGDNFEVAFTQLESSLLENQRLTREADEKVQQDVGTRETEIVIQGVNLENFDQVQQEKLLAFLSEMTDTEPSELNISSIQTGSVHVFIEMPTETAFALKTLALNNDPRFKKMRITAIRVVGTGIVTLSIPFWFALPGCLGVPAVSISAVIVITTLVVVVVTQGADLSPNVFLDSLENEQAVSENNTPTNTAIPPSITLASPLETETLTLMSAETQTATQTHTPESEVGGIVSASVNTRCRPTFNTDGEPLTFFDEGETAEVRGISQDGHWFYISPADTGISCWVSDATVVLSGSIAGIQVWVPTPTATATSTVVPASATAAPSSGGVSPGTIAGTIWEDTDDSGVFEYYDYFIEDVTVFLKDATCGDVISTTSTNALGEFSFLNIVPGDYCVMVDHTTLPVKSSGAWDAASPDFPIGDSPWLKVILGSGAYEKLDIRYIIDYSTTGKSNKFAI